MFVILSGSSGSGKNTVIKEMQKTKDNLVLMPTFTTREKRDGEVEGKPYFYITKEQFQEKIKNNEMIEHELIHGNFYGASYTVFEEYISNGNIIIKDIGVEGAQNLQKKLSDKTQILKIFLIVKKSELKKRLKERGEKQIKLRLKRYGYEKSQIDKFDYILTNVDLEKTSKLIDCLISLGEKDFYFKKEILKYNDYKIKYYMNKLAMGETLSPVKIAVVDNKAYVLKGAEKLIASFVSNMPVAKIILDKKVNTKKYLHTINEICEDE